MLNDIYRKNHIYLTGPARSDRKTFIIKKDVFSPVPYMKAKEPPISLLYYYFLIKIYIFFSKFIFIAKKKKKLISFDIQDCLVDKARSRAPLTHWKRQIPHWLELTWDLAWGGVLREPSYLETHPWLMNQLGFDLGSVAAVSGGWVAIDLSQRDRVQRMIAAFQKNKNKEKIIEIKNKIEKN